MLPMRLLFFSIALLAFAVNVNFVKATKNLLFRLGKRDPFVRSDAKLPPDMWFDQNLDHFNPTNTAVWKQRYFKNEEFFDAKNPGPVFLMIGGEGEATPKWMVNGTWIDYAKQFGALCFQLEHRFYGKSIPTEDLGVKNLVYLTSQQALADLANFITSMNDEYKFDSSVKWIVFGGSYPGSLAAWMRMQYPHLVHGSVSSSGPLLAKADFMEYYNVVVDSLRTTGDECVQTIQEAVRQIGLLLGHRIGQMNIDTKFNLCDPIEQASKLDYASFFEYLASNFAGVVQYNNDNRFSSTSSNITIDVICRLLTDKAAGSPVDRLANVNSMLLMSNNQTCTDYKYQKSIDKIRNITDLEQAERQWLFQTCNEFGFFQTSGGEPDIFSNNFPLDYFIQQCIDVFGSKFNGDYIDDAIRRTNYLYGGLDIQVGRVVFVHGSIDPWHALGITKTKDNNAPAIYIKGTAHCANMYPPRDSDLPHLKAARVTIAELIDSWLQK